MNAMKFTGKAFAVCFAACLAAAVFSSCGKKETKDPAPSEQSAGQTDAVETQAQPASQPASQAAAQPAANASPSAQIADDDMPFDLKPATEAEVLELLYFLPDPVATIDGEAIPRKKIIDDFIEQGIPVAIFKSIEEEKLRAALTSEIESLAKEAVMLKLAEEAGFKPSPEMVAKEMKEEFDESSEEEQEEIRELLKEQGLTLEEHMKQTSENPEIQKIAALRKYTHTTFLDKAKKEVADADVKKFYDEHVEELTKPAGLTVAHILIQPDEDEDDEEKADKDAKAKIDAIYDELLKNPSKFGELAREKSDCPSGKATEGKLPAFDKDGMMLDGSGAMDQTFTDAAFTIEKDGQITKPVKTRFGYHIIKRIEKSPEEVIPLDKVKDDITELLVKEKAQTELDKTLDEAIKKHVKFNEFAPAKPAADKAE